MPAFEARRVTEGRWDEHRAAMTATLTATGNARRSTQANPVDGRRDRDVRRMPRSDPMDAGPAHF